VPQLNDWLAAACIMTAIASALIRRAPPPTPAPIPAQQGRKP
jgi:hypothetical protein